MKYIFDFDDVLFNNTAQFKEYMFKIIAEACGLPIDQIRSSYEQVRDNFSLKDFIDKFLTDQDHRDENIRRVYQGIMRQCLMFVNTELRGMISYLGKDNCYLVTSGEPKFQEAKIRASGCLGLFKQIFYVSSSKKDAIEAICEANKTAEKIYFIDDKVHHFVGLDQEKYPNLKTIDFGSEEFDRLKRDIVQEKKLAEELKKRK